MHYSIASILLAIGAIVLPALAAKKPSCIAVGTHADMVTFYRCDTGLDRGDGKNEYACNELPLSKCVHTKDGILQIGS